jgi:glycosyltransferase involved in cell wall biosynthesis
MSEKKGVHLAIDGVGARFGGAATVLQDVVKAALRCDGIHSVTVFTSPSREMHFELPGVPRLQEIAVNGNGYTSRTGWLLRGLRKAAEKVSPDVVLCLGNGGIGPEGVPAAVFLQQSLPFSKEAMACFGLAEKIRFLGIRELMKISCKKADAVLVQSPSMKKEVCQKFRIPQEKVSVFPPSVEPEEPPDALSPQLRLLRDGAFGFKVLYVGNTRPYKNLQTVLKTVSKLRGQGMAVALYLTCSPDHPYCLTPGVVGIGALKKPALWAAYQLADLLVMPSLAETVGLPMLEAASSGLPVLAADRPYAHDTCGDAALYFDPNDPDDLAEKVFSLLSDPERRTAMARRGRELTANRNSDRPYDALIAALTALACGAGPRTGEAD